MAEQQKNQPPDLSPTEMTHPSVAPAGRYTFASAAYRYGLMRHPVARPFDSLYKTDKHHDVGVRHDDVIQTSPLHVSNSGSSHHSIEDLLHGIWQPEGPRDMVAGMFRDRVQAQTFELGDVLEQIKERIEIYQRHFGQLEQAKLVATNVRHHWIDPIRRHGAASDPDLVSAIQDLDAQQRQERLSCWKDLSSLRQQVPEHWRQYLNAARQYHLIESQGVGGNPYE